MGGVRLREFGWKGGEVVGGREKKQTEHRVKDSDHTGQGSGGSAGGCLVC